jgi:hypothetical protein
LRAELQDAARKNKKTSRINNQAGWPVVQMASPLACELKELIEQRLAGKLRHTRSLIIF